MDSFEAIVLRTEGGSSKQKERERACVHVEIDGRGWWYHRWEVSQVSSEDGRARFEDERGR